MHKYLIAMVALVSTSAANATWQEASSKHFVVISNDTQQNIRAYTTRLERFDQAVRALRGLSEDPRGAASRVTVFVVENVDEVRKLIGNNNVAGFYKDQVEGPVAFVPRKSGSGDGSQYDLKPEQILLHEYTHHIMYNDWPTAVFPKWFSEGFAEFHATALFDKDGSVTFGAQPLYRMSGAVRDPRLSGSLPLHDMLVGDSSKFNDTETYILYSRGWLLTHYLTFDPVRRKQLADYIGAITSGTPYAKAARILGDPDTLDRKLDGYVRMAAVPSITIAASDLHIGPIAVRDMTPGEIASIAARIRSVNGVDAKTAPAVVALARGAAASFPNDAAAQNELAEAELDACSTDPKSDAGCFSRSRAAADRALAADAKSVHATIYEGMAREAAAEKSKNADDATWRDVRHWYGAANRLDPENPWPLALYYNTFAIAKQTPTKTAEDGLLYAYALAPSSLNVRMNAAEVFLRRGQTAEAREAMLPVANSEHGGAYSKRVHDTITVLEKDGPAAALAVLKKKDEKTGTDAKKT